MAVPTKGRDASAHQAGMYGRDVSSRMNTADSTSMHRRSEVTTSPSKADSSNANIAIT
jgi:hypothetical protein